MDILAPYSERLSSAATAAEFAGLISDLDSELNSASHLKSRLLRDEDAALFGQGSLPEVRASIAALDAQIATVQRVIDGAGERMKAAAKSEAAAGAEALGEDVAKRAVELSSSWTEAVELAGRLREVLARKDRLERSVLMDSLTLEGAGRRDLMVNVKKIQREAIGQRPLPMDGLSRAGLDDHHDLFDLLYPRAQGRRTRVAGGEVRVDGGSRPAP